MQYQTPGVYIQEISKFPPSVAAVETAIPAFIGYVERTDYNGQDLKFKPTRIKSLAEYVEVFGGPYNETFSVTVNASEEIDTPPSPPGFVYKMYYALQLFFDNGGGPCYIVPVGIYNDSSSSVAKKDMMDGLEVLEKEDEPTIILFPDAPSLSSDADFYALYKQALVQCAKLKDRVAIVDVYDGDSDFQAVGGPDVINAPGGSGNPLGLRNGIGNNNLKYGAAYYPWLKTIYTFAYDETELKVTGNHPYGQNTTLKKDVSPGDQLEEKSIFHQNTELYQKIVEKIAQFDVVLPPGPAIAGIYATVDNNRGVWKAPANVSLYSVKEPSVILTDEAQQGLNVHTTGKSVNAIRKFSGKGTLVWGARTLAGNSNEWRYISVRRFYNMVEESVKKATQKFVFEPNDANTWAKVRGMISNYLTTLWRQGALAGATPNEAFFVSVGLGETMTSLDILNGRLIVEIGMATVRPAEFIILKFSHKMQEA